MSLELAFARDFVGWRNDHPRGAIFIAGMRLARALALMELGGLQKKRARVFRDFRDASMAQRRRSSITEQLKAA